ncbi:MAG: hypothetical protein V1800_13405 [Candidatus Latescibacterota bacterium]
MRQRDRECPGLQPDRGVRRARNSLGGYEPDTFVSAVLDMSKDPLQEIDSEETGLPSLRARFLLDGPTALE